MDWNAKIILLLSQLSGNPSFDALKSECTTICAKTNHLHTPSQPYHGLTIFQILPQIFS
jgi:hypothetical protein